MESDNTNKSQKLYYTMGEVTVMLGVNASLIRFWEQEFKDLKFRKNKKGNRLFSEDDVKKLKFIYFLVKERGHTLEGAKQKLSQPNFKTYENLEILESMRKLKSFLIELRSELKKIRE